jgi:hypothetical protein
LVFVYCIVAYREATDSSSPVLLPELQQMDKGTVLEPPCSSPISLALSNTRLTNPRDSSRYSPTAMVTSEPHAPPKKLACRTCSKISATKYDPIILCSSCRKPYHDSCRAPPLVAGLDPYALNQSCCMKPYLIELGVPGYAGNVSATVTNPNHRRRRLCVYLRCHQSRCLPK